MPTPERTLAPGYYTDPAVFDRECRDIMARSWQMAAHVSQLPEPGDYITLSLAGERVFVLRGNDGVLRGFYNVCQHRGHCLLEGEAGNTGRMIACPYHRWTYELDGRLKKARNSERTPGFDPATIRLAGIAAEEFCGFVFINLDAEARPMDEVYPGLRAEITDYVPGIERLQYAHGHWAWTHSNWKAAVENYNECYHCRCAHATFTRGIVDPASYRVEIEGNYMRHRSRASKHVSYDNETIGHEHMDEYRSWYFWPLASIQCYPGGIVNTYRWIPVSADETIAWREWFLEHPTPSVSEQQLIDLDRDTTFAEDLALLESVQKGMHSRGYRGGPLVLDPGGEVDSEHPVLHIKRQVLAGLDEHPEVQRHVG